MQRYVKYRISANRIESNDPDQFEALLESIGVQRTPLALRVVEIFQRVKYNNMNLKELAKNFQTSISSLTTTTLAIE